MKTTYKIEGLKDLQRALAELPKATSRNVVKRTLIKALEPIESSAEGAAPSLTGDLKRGINIGTKLTKRQASLHRAEFGGKPVMTAEGWRSSPKTEQFVFMGPIGSAKSIVQEFGSVNQSPRPYMRPAWDSNKMKALDIIRTDMWDEIEKAAARLAKKAAKLK